MTQRDDELDLELERFVAGGVSLGRDGDGRVVLAEGALPGERVRIRVTRAKSTLVQGRTIAVLEPAAQRIEAPCPEVERGCGGCDLQHASLELQRHLKVDVVRDALARIGRLPDVSVTAGEYLDGTEYRTILRCGVRDGRAGLRQRRSNEVHPLDACLVAHPWIDEILAASQFPDATEVVIRVGARTGERLVVVRPSTVGAVVPEGVELVGVDELASGADAWIHEVVARRRMRISAQSFFQARPDGAESLIRSVARAVAPFDPASDRLVDLYGGVGLFTAGLGARRSVLVERSTSSIGDALTNLSSLDAEVVQSDVEEWSPRPADVVVADPARAGLGPAGVSAVVGTGARRVALVSCDPASLARDARSLVDAGYQVDGVELVDLFPQTHHIEAVTALSRIDES